MTDAPNGWPDEAREAVAKTLPPIWGEETRVTVSAGILAALAPYHAAAMAAQAMAMREACAKVAKWACMVEPDGGSPSPEEVAVADEAARRILVSVPLPDTSALDAMLAEAKREGMREAAGIDCIHLPDDAAWLRGRARNEPSRLKAETMRAMADRLDRIAAAILAAAKGCK
jgi:hypothetical protein